jgi:C4-dicarboxylate-specific signal transduction histidine kinase
VTSPFRFYYFLSLMVCAIRHSSSVTYTTFGLHSISYLLLGLFSNTEPRMLEEEDAGSHQLVSGILTLVFMGWGTWAIVSLTGLLKKAGQRLALLNEQLKSNQQHLERRISARTRELQESQAMLVQQEKQAAFGLLAAGIAHEVGNPLASISSIVQLMSRRNTDSAVGDRLQLVDGQLQRIQRILKELTRFSRPANEQLASADVHAAINDALNIAKYYGRWKGKTVVTSFAEGLPHIRTVHDQLVQVMLNLILNALDAMAEGASIEISTRLLAAESGRPERLAIRIRDEGHGISKDAQKQIFQPYFTTKDHGTGLGLFVCRHITKNSLGGDIELLRSDASGTEFEVTLPVQRNTGE